MDENLRGFVSIRLTFDEVNIAYNMLTRSNNTIRTKSEFLFSLERMILHTPDTDLSGPLNSLREKVNRLSPAEFEQLRSDCISGRIMFPDNYILLSNI